MNLAHWERRLRLGSGLILVAFVVPHLTNHALGIFSFEAMEALRDWLALIWRSTAGTVLLYGAMALHFALALYSLFRRTTLRMSAWEAAQLILGLAIIPLLAFHAIFNRMVWELTTTEVDYHLVIATIWYTDFETWRIILLVLVVWVHLAIGLHFCWRVKSHYPTFLPFLYAISVLLPVLALLGFIRSGLNPAYSGGEKYVDQMLNSPFNTKLQFILSLEPVTIWTFVVLLLAVLLAREVNRIYARRYGVFRLQHTGDNYISVPVGRSILEALRAAGIPHASVCGGRARCTTCRVRISRGLDLLPPSGQLEDTALRRINAQPNVRLACQTRPQSDVTITPMVPTNVTPEASYKAGGLSGIEQNIVAMFVDLRGSTTLGQRRMPYDVIFILNQFFAELAEALSATRGHYAHFTGDGLLALYGLEGKFQQGCRDALTGATEMLDRLELLNKRLSDELDEPLRIGIGIHSGEAIVGTMGPPKAPTLSAIGDNINIAARLEAETKVFKCNIIVSSDTIRHAGLIPDPTMEHKVALRGREGEITVLVMDSVNDIPGFHHS
ncbi:MAG: adenylate/guanylate cyclase domain-containing protein [Dehalococcoidia bacterium]|nr:adenylate/guanylate cyclase domain-containing protein [Dehalococcoidia bacterium]